MRLQWTNRNPKLQDHTSSHFCHEPDTMRLTPCALAISGLDPSGGAGLLADVRAIEASGAWGCGIAAVTTVQSTAGMRRAVSVPVREWLPAVRELFAHQNVRAIKT